MLRTRSTLRTELILTFLGIVSPPPDSKQLLSAAYNEFLRDRSPPKFSTGAIPMFPCPLNKTEYVLFLGHLML